MRRVKLIRSLWSGLIMPVLVVGSTCAQDEMVNAPAGSNVAASDSVSNSFSPNLTTPGLLPVKSDVPQSCQVDNTEDLRPIPFFKSNEIPDSTFGVALTHGADVFENGPGGKGKEWGPYWLIDGDKDIESRNVNYSSKQFPTQDVSEWVEIDLGKSQVINRVGIVPRKGLKGFPLDFQILVKNESSKWQVVSKQVAFKPSGDNQQMFSFPPVSATAIRLLATKLPLSHDMYLQFQEVRAYGPDNDENLASADKGATAFAKNPLTGNEPFNYEKYYDNIFLSGVKWILIGDGWGLENQKLGKTQGKELANNLDFLTKNGVQVIYRFHYFPGISELKEDPEEASKAFVEAIKGTVVRLKGKVKVWVIGNEENFGMRAKFNGPEFPKIYASLVRKAAAAIKEIDPGSRIEIETALFDFGWTSEVLSAGLGEVIDQVGVHVYKELENPELMPEAVGTFIKDGKRWFPKDQPYSDYSSEVGAFRKLLDTFNPNIKIWVTETGANVGSGKYNITRGSQAKFLARIYLYNLILGLGPTCWWSLDYVQTGGTIWGLLDKSGERTPAWNTLRNLTSTFNGSFSQIPPDGDFSVENAPEHLISAIFHRDGGQMDEYLIPFWCAVPMRDGNSGVPVTVTLKGQLAGDVEAVDLFTGVSQRLNVERGDDGTAVIRGLIVRDYPVVLRIKKES